MTKPIAYYLSDKEDAETIEEIATTHGAHLEQLTSAQKTDLLLRILSEFWDRPLVKHGYCPPEISSRLKELSNDTLLGLLIATAQQIRDDQ